MTNMGDEVRKLYAKELAQTKKPNRRLSKPEIVVYTATVLMLLVAFTLGVYYYNKFAVLQYEYYIGITYCGQIMAYYKGCAVFH